MSKTPEPVKIRCNKCQNETWHEIAAIYVESDKDDEHGLWSDDVYSIVKCRGCGDVALLHQNYFSEDVEHFYNPDGSTGARVIPTEKVYPPRLARKTPTWFDEIEEMEVRAVLIEVYTALQNKAYRLAVAGVRTALERTMIQRVEDQGTFKGNLAAFIAAGHLPAAMEETFVAVLDAGHASAHRAFAPNEELLGHILDAIENMLWQVYISPRRTAAITAATPPRPGRV